MTSSTGELLDMVMSHNVLGHVLNSLFTRQSSPPAWFPNGIGMNWHRQHTHRSPSDDTVAGFFQPGWICKRNIHSASNTSHESGQPPGVGRGKSSSKGPCHHHFHVMCSSEGNVVLPYEMGQPLFDLFATARFC